MEQKEREDKLAILREQLAKLEEINVETLSDEDLESVAGGAEFMCSLLWCSSVDPSNDTSEDQ